MELFTQGGDAREDSIVTSNKKLRYRGISHGSSQGLMSADDLGALNCPFCLFQPRTVTTYAFG